CVKPYPPLRELDFEARGIGVQGLRLTGDTCRHRCLARRGDRGIVDPGLETPVVRYVSHQAAVKLVVQRHATGHGVVGLAVTERTLEAAKRSRVVDREVAMIAGVA